MPAQPRQSIILDEYGIMRFQENSIIAWLWKSGKLNMNEIASKDFSDADRRQLAQLLGYSVGGYQDLSYAENDISDEEYYKNVSRLTGENK